MSVPLSSPADTVADAAGRARLAARLGRVCLARWEAKCAVRLARAGNLLT